MIVLNILKNCILIYSFFSCFMSLCYLLILWREKYFMYTYYYKNKPEPYYLFHSPQSFWINSDKYLNYLKLTFWECVPFINIIIWVYYDYRKHI